PYEKDNVWACGGGFQSDTLAQQIANLINKKILIRDNYRQASVVGGALVCKEALDSKEAFGTTTREFHPRTQEGLKEAYQAWKDLRSNLHGIQQKGGRK